MRYVRGMKAAPEDQELIETVNGHLRVVSGSIGYNVDEATLRAITASLRFLLADDHLARAWRASTCKGPLVIHTWGLVRTGPGVIVALCGGGELLPGVPVSAGLNAGVERKKLDLHAFCLQTRVQVGEDRISTIELIQYFANKRGGVHFGSLAKKPKFELLRRLEAGELGGPPLKLNDRSLLHHEILSIAQALVNSPDVSRLRLVQAKTG